MTGGRDADLGGSVADGTRKVRLKSDDWVPPAELLAPTAGGCTDEWVPPAELPALMLGGYTDCWVPPAEPQAPKTGGSTARLRRDRDGRSSNMVPS